jgi:hypothetical protein
MLVAGYLWKLTENPRVARHLSCGNPKIWVELQKLAESRSLMDGAPAWPEPD